MKYINPFSFVEDVKEIERDLNDITEFKGERTWINYLFYNKTKASVDIYGVIHDIPYGHLEAVRNKIRKSGEFLINQFPYLKNIRLKNLENIFRLIPLRVSKNKILNVAKIVSLFDDILSQVPIDWRNFIEDFVLGARIHFFGTGGYQISKKKRNEGFNEMDMVRYILQTHHFIRFLSGGEDMVDVSFIENVDGDLKEYISTLGLDEEAASLFLLGYIVGEIGVRQYKDYGHKPILNKINFQGMDVERLLILFNEVLEKLHQMKIYGVEKIYHEAKRLMDRNLNRWSKSPQENVYYLLSGYAYRTAKALSKGGE